MKAFLKLILFTGGFFIFSFLLSLLLCDDHNSSARIMMHELYEQTNIDILYCGASHVSHSVTPEIADKMFTTEGVPCNTFNTGTSYQTIKGTYAILQQAVKLYNIKKVFLEVEFEITTQVSTKERTGFKSDYLVAKYIKSPSIKWKYLFSASTPKYYVNTFLPIGKDKYMSIDPEDIVDRVKNVFSGDYFNYVYNDKNDEYIGKGCLLDLRTVTNGSFFYTETKKPINVSGISQDWKDTIDKIIDVCRKNNIELVFYTTPCSDFCISALGNYDEYYTFLKEFTASRGYEYHDFNLAKEKYLPMEDDDFRDDNHLNKKGVYKFTPVMCDYFLGNIPKDDMFYNSYKQKMSATKEKVFGVILCKDPNKNSMDISPVTNCIDKSRIAYSVFALTDGERIVLADHTKNSHIVFPSGKSGSVIVSSFIDDVKQTECKINFAAF